MQIYNTILQTGILQGYNLLVIDLTNCKLSRIKKQDLKNMITARLQLETCAFFLIKLNKHNLEDKFCCKNLEIIKEYNYHVVIETVYTNAVNLATILPYAQTLIMRLSINNQEHFHKEYLEYHRLLFLLETRNSNLEIELDLPLELLEDRNFLTFLGECQEKVSTRVYVPSYTNAVQVLSRLFLRIRFLLKEF